MEVFILPYRFELPKVVSYIRELFTSILEFLCFSFVLKLLPDLFRNTEYSVKIQAMTVNGSGPATQWLNVETFANDLDG